MSTLNLDVIEPRLRRVWFAGDPEPAVGQKVLVVGTVWMRHPQLRWIAAPGGNGAPGLEWRRLVDSEYCAAIEVFDDEPYKPYGNLIRTPAAAPAPASQPSATVERGGLEAAYRDQSDHHERRQDMRNHVGDSSGYARCDGSSLDWGASRPVAEIPALLRCKKRGCKELWPTTAGSGVTA